MSQRLAATGVLTLLLTLVTAMAISGEPLPAPSPEIREPEEAKEVSIEWSTLRSDEQYYILKDLEGYVCILSQEGSDQTPVQTDILVSGLRVYDQKLLADGIEVKGAEELLKLLEDLGS